MITTPQEFLVKASSRINELTGVYTDQRLDFFDLAVQAVVDYKKWHWAKKKHTLTISAGVQEYDLTSAITDYNPLWGVDIVYVDGIEIFPVEYEDKGLYNSQRFALTPDKKSIVFTKTLDGTEVIEIWYYQRHVNVSAETDTLNIPLPEATMKGLVLYIKHLIHDAKRQRNDARNAILDFQEAMEELTLQGASKKAKHLPNNIVNPMRHAGIRRNYAKH